MVFARKTLRQRVVAVLLQNLLSSNGSLDHAEVVMRLIAIGSGLLMCIMRNDRVFHGLLLALGVYVGLVYGGAINTFLFG